ncbi:LysE/ArgO family amino acid transporter [Helicobacter bizzozeronii]|uniref:LysE/ArgO family amino acid transporter n=1 Tax=Helicobacter bizzozeronii TaxID=56877 RepID=UPI001F45E468|nr:LysE family transporter [Helicobacter bizzozeronii]
MCLGVFGGGAFLAKNKILNLIIASVGIVFVLYYTYLSIKSALSPHSSPKFAPANPTPLKKTILLTLAVTFLNPHAYLDTVFVIGASALAFSFEQKIMFVLGASCASCLWFFGLGYGALSLS